MADDDLERSESGNPILRHEERMRDFEFAVGDSDTIELIEQHITKHIGEPEHVFHEMISDLVHVDLHIVPPRPERNYYTIVSSGMSDLPMAVPEEIEDGKEYRFSELVICLPPDWPMSEEDIEDMQNFWPMGMLKYLARLPHEYETWFWAGHTIPNGDPPEPYAENTKLCCALLSTPMLFDEEFYSLKVNEEKTICFHSFVPIHFDEMEFALKEGPEALMERLAESGVSELLDISRESVCEEE